MFVDNYCGSYKIISGTLKRLLQAQISGNQAIFAVKKILAVFHRITEHDEPREKIY